MRVVDALEHVVTPLLGRLEAHPSVGAVVLTGSHAEGTVANDSDIDLFVYTDGDLLDLRREIARVFGSTSLTGLRPEQKSSSTDCFSVTRQRSVPPLLSGERSRTLGRCTREIHGTACFRSAPESLNESVPDRMVEHVETALSQVDPVATLDGMWERLTGALGPHYGGEHAVGN